MVFSSKIWNSLTNTTHISIYEYDYAINVNIMYKSDQELSIHAFPLWHAARIYKKHLTTTPNLTWDPIIDRKQVALINERFMG